MTIDRGFFYVLCAWSVIASLFIVIITMEDVFRFFYDLRDPCPWYNLVARVIWNLFVGVVCPLSFIAHGITSAVWVNVLQRDRRHRREAAADVAACIVLSTRRAQAEAISRAADPGEITAGERTELFRSAMAGFASRHAASRVLAPSPAEFGNYGDSSDTFSRPSDPRPAQPAKLPPTTPAKRNFRYILCRSSKKTTELLEVQLLEENDA